ncbi:MAG: CehA/McbA family metallohydrolase [Vicinamibacteria bacterium]
MSKRSTPIFLSAMISAFFACATMAQTEAPSFKWYKGNTHTHTINTDGDSSPVDVVKFYREQGYNFLILSDHDSITPTDGLNALFGTVEGHATDRIAMPFHPFLLIPGEEVTDAFIPEVAGQDPKLRDLGRKEIHLIGVNVTSVVSRQKGSSVVDTLQRDVDAIRRVGGVPIINHPNFVWSLTGADLMAVKNAPLLEIWNGHMQTNNLGGGDTPSAEGMWDQVLSAEITMYGVAADDAHFFKTPVLGTSMSVPGRAYIMVRSQRFTAGALTAAMERGDFYASTGVELADIVASNNSLTVKIDPLQMSRYRVIFIGREGRVLKEVAVVPSLPPDATRITTPRQADPVTYEFKGDEGYVRVKVIDSNGYMAWTQPVRVSKP